MTSQTPYFCGDESRAILRSVCYYRSVGSITNNWKFPRLNFGSFSSFEVVDRGSFVLPWTNLGESVVNQFSKNWWAYLPPAFASIAADWPNDFDSVLSSYFVSIFTIKRLAYPPENRAFRTVANEDWVEQIRAISTRSSRPSSD